MRLGRESPGKSSFERSPRASPARQPRAPFADLGNDNDVRGSPRGDLPCLAAEAASIAALASEIASSVATPPRAGRPTHRRCLGRELDERARDDAADRRDRRQHHHLHHHRANHRRAPSFAPPPTLATLQPDALSLILSRLDPRSLAACSSACRELRRAAGDDALWRAAFLARWRWRPPTWALSAALPWTSPLSTRATAPPKGGWRAAYAERIAQQPNHGETRRRASVERHVVPTTPTRDADAREIQAALDVSRPGDVVLVHAGTYAGEGVRVPPGVELRGVGRREEVMIVTEETTAVVFDAASWGDGSSTAEAEDDGGTISTSIAISPPTTTTSPGVDDSFEAPPPPVATTTTTTTTTTERSPSRALSGLVTNLTLWRQSASSAGTLAGSAPVAAVLVASGALRLDSVNVVSAGEGVVAQPRARAVLHACDISAVLSGFVSTRGTLSACMVSAAKTDAPTRPETLFAAVTTLTGATTVVNNRVVYGTAHGVAVLDGGGGVLKDNLIASNAGAGVCVGSLADPRLEGNLVADNGGQGVAVYNGGRGTLRSCEIRSNAQNGIDVTLNRPANHPRETYSELLHGPHVDSCHVHDNAKHGVCATGGAGVRVTQCDVFDNKEHGIFLTDGSKATIEHTRLNGGAGHALVVSGAGTAPSIFSCKIGTHGKASVVVEDLAEPMLLATEIAGASAAGVSFASGGAGVVRGCNVHRNEGPGIVNESWGSPTIEWSHVHDGLGDGVVFAAGAKGTLRHCKVRRNKDAGVWIKAGAAPSVTRNHISKNGKGGVRIGDTGEGAVEITSDSRWHEPTETETAAQRRARRLARWNGRREEPAASALHGGAFDETHVDATLVREVFAERDSDDEDEDEEEEAADAPAPPAGAEDHERGDSGSGPDENGDDEEVFSSDEDEFDAEVASIVSGSERGSPGEDAIGRRGLRYRWTDEDDTFSI